MLKWGDKEPAASQVAGGRRGTGRRRNKQPALSDAFVTASVSSWIWGIFFRGLRFHQSARQHFRNAAGADNARFPFGFQQEDGPDPMMTSWAAMIFTIAGGGGRSGRPWTAGQPHSMSSDADPSGDAGTVSAFGSRHHAGNVMPAPCVQQFFLIWANFLSEGHGSHSLKEREQLSSATSTTTDVACLSITW